MQGTEHTPQRYHAVIDGIRQAQTQQRGRRLPDAPAPSSGLSAVAHYHTMTTAALFTSGGMTIGKHEWRLF